MLTEQPTPANLASVASPVTAPGVPQSIVDSCLATIRQAQAGDFTDWTAILKLPGRGKSTRALAEAISCQLFPEQTPTKASISYASLVQVLKTSAREERARSLAPKTNKKGNLVRPQGAWKGQALDPVSLDGPMAMPMPVTIPPEEEFRPVFDFLKRNEDPHSYICGQQAADGITPGEELNWGTPMIEFHRGIIYEDGRLDLCKMVTGPNHITPLMDSLESNTHISQFLLGNNVISGTGADRIAKFIAKYPERIETWYLAGGHINAAGLRKLVNAMVMSERITNVWLKRNPLGPDAAGVLADLVHRTKNLRTLDLENTELGDKGMAAFFQSLKGQKTSLRNIFLNANGIGESASQALAEYLDDPCTQMGSIFLGSNPIGDAGMKYLAPAFARHQTLQRLSLTSTGLTPKGINDLCVALNDHPAFTSLDLSASVTTIPHGQRYNWITGACANALASLIRLPTLRFLSLGHIWISHDDMKIIEGAVIESNLVNFASNINIVGGTEDTAHILVDDQANQSTSDVDDSNSDNDSNSGGDSAVDLSTPRKYCLLAVRRTLYKNVQKFYPHITGYRAFQRSNEFRFLRNTPDVRLIDSHYRTANKREDEPNEQYWKAGDPVWAQVLEDAAAYQ